MLSVGMVCCYMYNGGGRVSFVGGDNIRGAEGKGGENSQTLQLHMSSDSRC